MKNTLLIILLNFLSLSLFSQSSELILKDNWKAKRATDVLIDGNEITSGGFRPVGWIDATVPGTILTTLLKNGLVPDPFFGMNNDLIPDIYDTGRDYYTYWFYTEFEIQDLSDSQEAWLCFRGINYFAEIFLNGKRVNTTTHQGMFLREKYLITPYLNNGKINRLAVWVAPPDPAGNAFAGQGGDGTIGRNVGMQFTAGWDWICPIRDRNTGIWDKVSIEITGEADLRNPFVETFVPGIRIPGEQQAPARIRVSSEIVNTYPGQLNGILKITFGDYTAEEKVTLGPNEEKVFRFREIKIGNPRLWWPNGMGDQPLYNLRIDLVDQSGKSMDSENVTFGIRETGNYFDDQIKARVFTVNGQKVFIKGGNWIASDALLRLSEERYDAEIKYHASMNMNMIRVWGGGLTERPEFYDACDRYGILVWQDIWITGDCNGEWNDQTKKDSQARRKSYPDDHRLFIESLTDQIKMLRNHPGLYLWCGGNETYPPPDILETLERVIFPQYDPGRFFLDKSTSPVLMTNDKGGTGDGPYGIREPERIFTERSFPFNPETGSIGIPNYEGLLKIIPVNELVPPRTGRPSQSWQYHKYLSLADFPDRYGKVKDIRDFCFKSQIVSYEQYRALQEGFNYKMWDWYSGMLVWKNQNPWTALRGSFYDYYLDCNGGYYGYRHGAEPVHIQLNLNDSSVCILNQTPLQVEDITASVLLYDLHGKQLSANKMKLNLNPNEKILTDKILLPGKNDEIYFLKLKLEDNSGIIDENLYWLSAKPHSYERLNELQQVRVTALTKRGTGDKINISVTNPSDEPAFFLRLKVTGKNDELISPAFFSDNYFTLMPGETKEVTVQIPDEIFAQSQIDLKLVVEGWNTSLTWKLF
jgi:mannosylglycoprotein endo-beta-mannosidase